MRFTNLLFVLFFFLAGCGTKDALYLPEGEAGEVQPVSIREETFQPETRQQELQDGQMQQDEEEEE